MTGVVHGLEPAALPLRQSEYDELAAQEKTKLLADADNDQKETSAHHHSANAVSAGGGSNGGWQGFAIRYAVPE